MQQVPAELWRRWRGTRDHAAFAALVLPELPRAVAVACGAGCDRAAAEDAVQDALVALASERTDAPLTLGVRTWLFRAVRDRARSGLRADRRRRRREASAARPEAVVARTPGSDAAELVERALKTLDDADREAVRLRCALDLDYREVAAVLGTSEGAARVRVHRALERLRKRLGGDAATLLAAMPLPALARPEALVAGAISKIAAVAAAGATGSAAGGVAVALGTGGAAMVSAKAMVAIGVLAFGVGAGAAWTARDAPTDDDATSKVVVPLEPRPERVPPKRAARADDAPKPAGTTHDASEADRSLGDLAPTEEERAWLRGALVAERERRRNAVILPDDAGTDILERWLRNGADIEPILASFETAAAHVRTGTGTTHKVEATGPTTAANPPADASVVEFGPGRFTLGREWRSWSERRTGAETIEVRGAGADRTTIVANGDFLFCWEQATLRNVRIRDLTVESVENLIDARGAVSVALEGVRVVGWQSGGHSSPIGVSGRAFIACRDCEFVGSDGIGVASLRGPGAIVFERCSFFDVEAAVLGGGAASGGRPSVVRFVDCRFEDSRVADGRIRHGRDVEIDLRVRGGTVALLGPGATEDERRRAWGADHAADVSGVTFGPAAPRFTVGEALRALESAAAAGVRDIVGLDVGRSTRGAPPVVEIYFLDARGSLARTVRRLLPGGLGEPEESRRGMRGFHAMSAGDVAGFLPLAELLRRAGLAETDAFSSASIAEAAVQATGETAPRKVWCLQVDAGGRKTPMLDARTGTPVVVR